MINLENLPSMVISNNTCRDFSNKDFLSSFTWDQFWTKSQIDSKPFNLNKYELLWFGIGSIVN